jgi:NADH dehydrogenase [ubiquinone] 1 alpha subcomplex assembly factor 5
VSESVAASGIPQIVQPEWPRNSTSFQQSEQKLWTSATIVPQPAQRGGSAKSSAHRAQVRAKLRTMSFLSLATARRTSAAVAELFDMKLRAIRRDRAARRGPELFLLERAFDDCLERIALGNRRFDRTLLIGCPDSTWVGRLREVADSIDVRDPGPLFASAAGGQDIVEDAWDSRPQAYDLVLAVGTLDTVNSLPLALQLIRHAMRADGLFIGAMSGGETLPQLRSAMRAADAAAGAAAPHIHPRIEASALAPLLSQAGFHKPVVDVDRVSVSYPLLDRLVADLRAMAATNLLSARPRFFSRTARAAATSAFVEAGDGERTTETFEILHFAAWTPGDN